MAELAMDMVYSSMFYNSLSKEEINKLHPRKYYPSEISLMCNTWEYKENDFKNWYYIK